MAQSLEADEGDDRETDSGRGPQGQGWQRRAEHCQPLDLPLAYKDDRRSYDSEKHFSRRVRISEAHLHSHPDVYPGPSSIRVETLRCAVLPNGGEGYRNDIGQREYVRSETSKHRVLQERSSGPMEQNDEMASALLDLYPGAKSRRYSRAKPTDVRH